MIKKILPFILQAVFVLAGVAGGIQLKSMLAAPAEAHATDADDEEEGEHAAKPDDSAHGDDKKDKKKKKEKSGGHGAEESDPSKSSGFIKFSRQFVVPVIHDTGVHFLLVLDIGIQVPPSGAEGLYTFEPKLRDAVLTELLKLSSEGAFDDEFFEHKRIDALKTRLLDAARTIIGADAEQILVLGIARQEV